ncbi:hypothetical protein CPB85DRAFT_1310064 [Mucidula mucida]|nr:hypothetical protein CPB85DRAFT_1310064 [Mucidula mucida]
MSDTEDDEFEAAIARIRQRADELAQAAKLMREQCDLNSKIWVKSIDREKRGNNISLMLKDIQVFAPSAGATGPAKRFTANTMGYQALLPKLGSESPSKLEGDIKMQESSEQGTSRKGRYGASITEAIVID